MLEMPELWDLLPREAADRSGTSSRGQEVCYRGAISKVGRVEPSEASDIGKGTIGFGVCSFSFQSYICTLVLYFFSLSPFLF